MRIEIKRAGELRNYEKLLTENTWRYISILMDTSGKQSLKVRNENQEYEFYTSAAIALCYGEAAIFDGMVAVSLGRNGGNSRKLRIVEIDIYDPEYLPDSETDADIYIESVEEDA